ncbi:MAG: hypothetical protein PHV34_09000 [Verrucomicrobiae bacterium]|nr:hypothetical protein [Verrucomicrobiae bacterium]
MSPGNLTCAGLAVLIGATAVTAAVLAKPVMIIVTAGAGFGFGRWVGKRFWPQ